MKLKFIKMWNNQAVFKNEDNSNMVYLTLQGVRKGISLLASENKDTSALEYALTQFK